MYDGDRFVATAMSDWFDALTLSVTEGPRIFAEGVLGERPAPWQAQAFDDMVAFDRHAWRSGHGVGKTHSLAIVGCWFMCTRRNYKVPVTANSQDQLRDVTWAELAKVFRALPVPLKEQFEIGLERISFRQDPENNFAVPRTASRDKPEALQGFHSENVLFLVEEASGIDDIVFEVAGGALSTPGAKILMVGNPTRTSGYFHRAFHGNRVLWRTRHIPFQLVIGQPWADANYPQQVINEYGENSNVYRVRVLGEFPVSDDSAVIPLALIEAAIIRDVLPKLRSSVWGVDVARYGDDRSALIKRRANCISEPARIWRNRDTMQTAGIVAKEFFETPLDNRPAAINVDVIGIGAGVADRLREVGLPAVGVNVGEIAEDGDRFRRRRDELWWRARDWFTARDCKIVRDDHLIADLVGPTYNILSNGKIEVEDKDKMKKRGIASPDVADAFCLTFAGGEFAGLHRMLSHALDDYNPLDMERSHRRDKMPDHAENDYGL